VKTTIVVLAASTIGTGLVAALVTWRAPLRQPPLQPAASGPAPIRKGLQITEEYRRVYPYSVVPGGAVTVEEARRAMSDPAIRDQYAAVDLKRLKRVVLSADLSGYVSYRFGDKIYWTAKTVRLKAGEPVFTDGQHIVRGRCLNSYSVHPMAPVRPHEPEEKVLETWVEVPVLAFSFPPLPLETPVLPPPAQRALPAARPSPQVHHGRFIPILPFIPPIWGHSHRQPTPVLAPPPPVTVIPEPSYTPLVATGLLLLVFSRWLRKRRPCAHR